MVAESSRTQTAESVTVADAALSEGTADIPAGIPAASAGAAEVVSAAAVAAVFPGPAAILTSAKLPTGGEEDLVTGSMMAETSTDVTTSVVSGKLAAAVSTGLIIAVAAMAPAVLSVTSVVETEATGIMTVAASAVVPPAKAATVAAAVGPAACEAVAVLVGSIVVTASTLTVTALSRRTDVIAPAAVLAAGTTAGVAVSDGAAGVVSAVATLVAMTMVCAVAMP